MCLETNLRLMPNTLFAHNCTLTTHVGEGCTVNDIIFLQSATQSEFALSERTAMQACQVGNGPSLKDAVRALTSACPSEGPFPHSEPPEGFRAADTVHCQTGGQNTQSRRCQEPTGAFSLLDACKRRRNDSDNRFPEHSRRHVREMSKEVAPP